MNPPKRLLCPKHPAHCRHKLTDEKGPATCCYCKAELVPEKGK